MLICVLLKKGEMLWKAGQCLSQSWLEVSQWDEWMLWGIPGPLLEFHISYAIFGHQFVKNQNPDNHVNLVKREERGEHTCAYQNTA